MAKAKKLPSGSWYIQVSVNGERFSQAFPSKNEAEYWAAEIKLKGKRKAESMTLGEGIDKYIESKSARLEETSKATYKKIKRLYFLDLMDVPIKTITQEQIQNEINEQAKTLSSKTVRSNHGLISAVFKRYRKDLVLETILPKKQKFVPNIPDIEDTKKIMINVKGTNNEAPVLLALWLGLRMSEIRGLKWEHIKGNLITIKEAVVDVDNTQITKGTKSFAGTRTLYMPNYIKDLINELPKTSEYVVTTKRCTIIDRYNTMLERAGLPHYRFHDLRHANASIMLMLNIPDKYAMDRLGHATPNTLKNIYQHILDSKKTDMNDVVNGYFESLISHKNAHAQ